MLGATKVSPYFHTIASTALHIHFVKCTVYIQNITLFTLNLQLHKHNLSTVYSLWKRNFSVFTFAGRSEVVHTQYLLQLILGEWIQSTGIKGVHPFNLLEIRVLKWMLVLQRPYRNAEIYTVPIQYWNKSITNLTEILQKFKILSLQNMRRKWM